MAGIRVLSTGSCLPSKVITNEDMSRMVDTNDEWITKRTGIKERRYCEGQTHFDLAYAASLQALERAGIDKAEIGVCVVATISPDYTTPTCACLLQAALGLSEDTPCFDINAACTGFLYAVRAAQGMVTKQKPYALVVGCEVLTRMTDFSDRGTCILFGDGAGAIIMEVAKDACDPGTVLGSRGDKELLHIPSNTAQEPCYIHMQGTAVFKFAVDIVPKCMEQVLCNAGMSVEDMDCIVLHQANERILDHVVKKMHLPTEKVIKIIDRYGNMSAACIPIALDELYTQGRLAAGMKLLCVGFGGGLTWGGAVLEMGGRK